MTVRYAMTDELRATVDAAGPGPCSVCTLLHCYVEKTAAGLPQLVLIYGTPREGLRGA